MTIWQYDKHKNHDMLVMINFSVQNISFAQIKLSLKILHRQSFKCVIYKPKSLKKKKITSETVHSHNVLLVLLIFWVYLLDFEASVIGQIKCPYLFEKYCLCPKSSRDLCHVWQFKSPDMFMESLMFNLSTLLRRIRVIFSCFLQQHLLLKLSKHFTSLTNNSKVQGTELCF